MFRCGWCSEFLLFFWTCVSLSFNLLDGFTLKHCQCSLRTHLALSFPCHVSTSTRYDKVFDRFDPGVLPMTKASSSVTTTKDSVAKKNVIVISPAGGAGEVSATLLAKLGHSVRWFVVGDRSFGGSIGLPKETYGAIQSAGGSLDVTGGDAEGLLLPEDDPRSSVSNLEQWCAVNALTGNVDGIVVSLDDGVDGESDAVSSADPSKEVPDAVKRVAQMACSKVSSSVRRVEIVPFSRGEEGTKMVDEGGLKNWLLNPFAGTSITLREAVCASGDSGSADLLTVRHGVLFGVPESDRDAAPFVNGPRREPFLREEYTNQAVFLAPTKSRRLDPDNLRTSRLTLAEAVTRSLSLDTSTGTSTKFMPRDFTVSSLRGSVPPTDTDWAAEFDRLISSTAKAVDAEGATILFETTYDDVPNVAKLADWIAYKWAPTVMSTYDIAGIRKGARPVFASRVPKSEENEEAVEIYWQELINFEDTKTVGKMIIRVNNRGMSASRKALSDVIGMLRQGTPFPGENVLVRRLADAAVQAVEKGLAVKRKSKQAARVAAKKGPGQAVLSSEKIKKEPVIVEAMPPEQRKPELESGPRSSGARRSATRRRGKRTAGQAETKGGGEQ